MKINLYDDAIGFVEYVQHMGDDLTIVNAARVSFGKHKTEIDEKDKKLIKYLVAHNHTSTLEHNVITFRIKVPLYVARQHMRHRTFSYNEISRRYTDVDFQFYEPKEFRTQHKSNRQASNEDGLINPRVGPPEGPHGPHIDWLVKDHHQQSLRLYDDLIESGVCREQARGILPQNLYTEYYATCNLNNLIKFIRLRTHEGAQWEIQKLAEGCRDIANSLWPTAMNALENKK